MSTTDTILLIVDTTATIDKVAEDTTHHISDTIKVRVGIIISTKDIQDMVIPLPQEGQADIIATTKNLWEVMKVVVVVVQDIMIAMMVKDKITHTQITILVDFKMTTIEIDSDQMISTISTILQKTLLMSIRDKEIFNSH